MSPSLLAVRCQRILNYRFLMSCIFLYGCTCYFIYFASVTFCIRASTTQYVSFLLCSNDPMAAVLLQEMGPYLPRLQLRKCFVIWTLPEGQVVPCGRNLSMILCVHMSEVDVQPIAFLEVFTRDDKWVPLDAPVEVASRTTDKRTENGYNIYTFGFSWVCPRFFDKFLILTKCRCHLSQQYLRDTRR